MDVPRTLIRLACLAMVASQLPGAVAAQQAAADPLGLTALNAAFHLTRSELSLDLQQGGMSHFQPYILPLTSANGVQVWGKDASTRADHLNFYIRYGKYTTSRPAPRILDTDVANLIGIEHTTTDVPEHLAHQETLRVIRERLGAMTACRRDTVVANQRDAIWVASTAVWQRNDAQVVFHTRVLHRAPRRMVGASRPELRLIYDVVRAGSSATSFVPRLPTRLDPGCPIERAELELLAVPMSPDLYRAWEARIQAR